MSESAGVERLEVHAQELELGWEGAIGGPGVHPGAERVQLRSQLRLELRGLALGGAAQAQGSHEAVGPQPGATGDLGQPPGADPAVEVELPEAVLSVAEALGEPQVVPGLGVDVGNSPAVAADLDRALEALQPQAPLVLGSGRRKS